MQFGDHPSRGRRDGAAARQDPVKVADGCAARPHTGVVNDTADTPTTRRPDRTAPGGGARSTRSRQRRTSLWITVGIIVVLVVVVAWAAIKGATGPAESAFVDRIRTDNPELSIADVSDQRLLAAAWATCRPEGLSDADQALLERLDIDPERFREAAADICPSR